MLSSHLLLFRTFSALYCSLIMLMMSLSTASSLTTGHQVDLLPAKVGYEARQQLEYEPQFEQVETFEERPQEKQIHHLKYQVDEIQEYPQNDQNPSLFGLSLKPQIQNQHPEQDQDRNQLLQQQQQQLQQYLTTSKENQPFLVYYSQNNQNNNNVDDGNRVYLDARHYLESIKNTKNNNNNNQNIKNNIEKFYKTQNENNKLQKQYDEEKEFIINKMYENANWNFNELLEFLPKNNENHLRRNQLETDTYFNENHENQENNENSNDMNRKEFYKNFQTHKNSHNDKYIYGAMKKTTNDNNSNISSNNGNNPINIKNDNNKNNIINKNKDTEGDSYFNSYLYNGEEPLSSINLDLIPANKQLNNKPSIYKRTQGALKGFVASASRLHNHHLDNNYDDIIYNNGNGPLLSSSIPAADFNNFDHKKRFNGSPNNHTSANNNDNNSDEPLDNMKHQKRGAAMDAAGPIDEPIYNPSKEFVPGANQSIDVNQISLSKDAEEVQVDPEDMDTVDVINKDEADNEGFDWNAAVNGEDDETGIHLPYGIQNVRKRNARSGGTYDYRNKNSRTYQSLCPTKRVTIPLETVGFEYRPNHYIEVTCAHNYNNQHNFDFRNKVCTEGGFSCIQLNRTIHLIRRSKEANEDCWESEIRVVPSGCECMWPMHNFGDIRVYHDERKRFNIQTRGFKPGFGSRQVEVVPLRGRKKEEGGEGFDAYDFV